MELTKIFRELLLFNVLAIVAYAVAPKSSVVDEAFREKLLFDLICHRGFVELCHARINDSYDKYTRFVREI